MDHNEAVRQKATERYLLDELDPELRDQFEEHKLKGYSPSQPSRLK